MSGIHFVDVDGDKLLGDARRELERLLGDTLQPGDARYLLLLSIMQIILGGFALIDQTGRANLLRYASGETLDALGERVDAPRLPATPASLELRFDLAEAAPVATAIPAGTRVTPDGTGYFATERDLIIPAGAINGSVTADFILNPEIDATAYNGIAPAASFALVDMIPGVSGAVSLTESAGGRAGETDDAYRERIRLAPSHFAATGTADAYKYHALSATTQAIDAGVRQAGPGEVEIAIIPAPDADAGEAVYTVQKYVSDPIRRTLTDQVTVLEAAAVPYDITMTYYAAPLKLAEVVQAVEGPGGAIERYTDWQDSRIGRAINPDKLRALMLEAGAERIDLTDPAYSDVGPTERASVGTVTAESAPLGGDPP